MSVVCTKLELDFYNLTFEQGLESWFDIPVQARESMSYIPNVHKLKSVLYFSLKQNPKISIRDSLRKYDVSKKQCERVHKLHRELKAYKVEVIHE